MKRPAPNEAMPLYGLFEDIIRKDERSIDELIRITQIVLCARRPMFPKELYVLLHQEHKGPFDSSEISDVFLTKHVLEVSKGLAEVTKSAVPTVQFIHETVREFLRDGGLKSISTQSLDRTGHDLMVASCLEQIYAPLSEHLALLDIYRRRGDYRNVTVHGVTKERQRIFRWQAKDTFPFLEYATRNVFFHAEELEAMKVSQSQFLESFPIDEWIPIYNLFEESDIGRYGTDTPILYILSGHGCYHLIENSAKFTGQYAQEVKDNECSSALAHAIFKGQDDTTWTLVGLDARARPRDIKTAIRGRGRGRGSPLIPVLLEFGDVQLMRKLLEDRKAMIISVPANLDFSLVSSAEMIDLFLEVSDVPGFPSVGHHQQHPQADREAVGSQWSNKNLIYIRKAIETEPSLLESEAWGGKTMCNYAFSQGIESLVSLFLEYSGGGQSEVDSFLHQTVEHGQLEGVKLAIRFKANLASQDKNGKTALHISAASYRYDRQREEITRYLLSEDPSCVKVRDFSGWTPLHSSTATSRAGFNWENSIQNNILETFVQAGADVNAVSKCSKCSSAEGHEVPLATFLLLADHVELFEKLASNNRCDLNGRDNFGRTALSWCLAYRHGDIVFSEDHPGFRQDRALRFLLQQPAVDVNSRDDSGHTILEHFIRYPICNLRSPVKIFFESERLDSNLKTSNGQHPLELIVSLYNTLPIMFSDIGPETGILDFASLTKTIEGPRRRLRQQEFNKHLIQATELLLRTGKVESEVQWRCADQAPSELREVIIHSRQVGRYRAKIFF